MEKGFGPSPLFDEADRLRAVNAKLLAALEANTVYLEAVYDTLPSLRAARQGAGLIKRARAVIEEAKK